ncbi:MAG: AraC family transcriptional regulator [Sphingobacteriales bacterium]|nr:MAG: AraC family transcriptional regulator [Sphingobacteriales bacterium]
MRLLRFQPYPALVPFIESIWCFESDCGIPLEDMRLIVPNGQPKLVIPYDNGLVSTMNEKHTLAKDLSVTLIGMADIPAIINAQSESKIGTIGVEFNAKGAYRFFHLPFHEITNEVYQADDVLGKEVTELQRRVASAGTLQQRVGIVQDYLLKKLTQSKQDAIMDYCIDELTKSNGLIAIEELARKTGYTRRYLSMKFNEKAGVSPKTLASIYRFHHFYKLWAQNSTQHFFEKEFYDYYYDQAHFIKDFKRFTNMPPAKFAKVENELGRIFYKD